MFPASAKPDIAPDSVGRSDQTRYRIPWEGLLLFTNTCVLTNDESNVFCFTCLQTSSFIFTQPFLFPSYWIIGQLCILRQTLTIIFSQENMRYLT
jgi:hypothetical protein